MGETVTGTEIKRKVDEVRNTEPLKYIEREESGKLNIPLIERNE